MIYLGSIVPPNVAAGAVCNNLDTEHPFEIFATKLVLRRVLLSNPDGGTGPTTLMAMKPVRDLPFAPLADEMVGLMADVPFAVDGGGTLAIRTLSPVTARVSIQVFKTW